MQTFELNECVSRMHWPYETHNYRDNIPFWVLWGLLFCMVLLKKLMSLIFEKQAVDRKNDVQIITL